MDTFIIILADLAIIIFILRWVAKKSVTNQLNIVKKDPKKFLSENIDESVKNKERLLEEIGKIDEIVKVDYWGWIKGMFKNREEKRQGIIKIEALVKTADGLELWYKFTMKKNKLIGIEKTYKPIT